MQQEEVEAFPERMKFHWLGFFPLISKPKTASRAGPPERRKLHLWSCLTSCLRLLMANMLLRPDS